MIDLQQNLPAVSLPKIILRRADFGPFRLEAKIRRTMSRELLRLGTAQARAAEEQVTAPRRVLRGGWDWETEEAVQISSQGTLLWTGTYI